MLNRMKRDPRVDLSDLPQPELAALRSTNLTNSTYAEFLGNYGVERVEFDNVPQGIDIDSGTIPFRASLYYPVIVVAALDQCVIGSAHHRHDGDDSCQRECLRYAFQMKQLGVTMIGRGMYMLNESLEHVNLSAFDRIIRVLA
jgi:hypothetical protein